MVNDCNKFFGSVCQYKHKYNEFGNERISKPNEYFDLEMNELKNLKKLKFLNAKPRFEIRCDLLKIRCTYTPHAQVFGFEI